jgi:MFS family permease
MQSTPWPPSSAQPSVPSVYLPPLPPHCTSTNTSFPAAGYLTQYLNWRWIFWTVSIADALVQILACLFLPETYTPKILLLKARRLRKETGNDKLLTEYERPDRTFGQTLRKNLVRPFIMLFTQPALQVTALYRAYLYGLMYLV